MRPENVHGYTFPNALTSFAVEERSKDHFTVVILSLVVFITSDETACHLPPKVPLSPVLRDNPNTQRAYMFVVNSV